jgi:hypothetical protein
MVSVSGLAGMWCPLWACMNMDEIPALESAIDGAIIPCIINLGDLEGSCLHHRHWKSLGAEMDGWRHWSLRLDFGWISSRQSRFLTQKSL